MTISTIYTPEDLTTSGVGPYAFNWDVIAEDNIEVLLDGVVVPPGDYSVILVQPGPIFTGGSVTFNSAPAPGLPLQIRRVTPRTQEVNYQEYNAFPAATHEFALDKLTLISQEQDVLIGEGGP